MEVIMIILITIAIIGSIFTIIQNIYKKVEEQNQLLKEICNELRDIKQKE
ncbi:MAG: hypothetical protein ACI4L2_01775 [Wujia sp.]